MQKTEKENGIRVTEIVVETEGRSERVDKSRGLDEIEKQERKKDETEKVTENVCLCV